MRTDASAAAQSSPPPRPATGLELARIRRSLWEEGTDRLGDDALLALCLGRGRAGLSALDSARLLLERGGSLERIARAKAPALTQYDGIDRQGAAQLVAAFELGRRALRDEVRPRPNHPLDRIAVSRWATPRLAGLEHEEVWVLCVDARTALTSSFQVGRGGAHGCALLTRDVLTPVIREGACGFVLVHNHPSGDPTPSREDIELTRSLKLAAHTLDIPLLDHVVVARSGSSSFFELGLL